MILQYFVLFHPTKKNTVNMIRYCVSTCKIIRCFRNIICKTRTYIFPMSTSGSVTVQEIRVCTWTLRWSHVLWKCVCVGSVPVVSVWMFVFVIPLLQLSGLLSCLCWDVSSNSHMQAGKHTESLMSAVCWNTGTSVWRSLLIGRGFKVEHQCFLCCVRWVGWLVEGWSCIHSY